MDMYKPKKSHPYLDKRGQSQPSRFIPKQPWDSSISDLSKLALTIEEQVKRKLSSISPNDSFAGQRLLDIGNNTFCQGVDGKVSLVVEEEVYPPSTPSKKPYTREYSPSASMKGLKIPRTPLNSTNARNHTPQYIRHSRSRQNNVNPSVYLSKYNDLKARLFNDSRSSFVDNTADYRSIPISVETESSKEDVSHEDSPFLVNNGKMDLDQSSILPSSSTINGSFSHAVVNLSSISTILPTEGVDLSNPRSVLEKNKSVFASQFIQSKSARGLKSRMPLDNPQKSLLSTRKFRSFSVSNDHRSFATQVIPENGSEHSSNSSMCSFITPTRIIDTKSYGMVSRNGISSRMSSESKHNQSVHSPCQSPSVATSRRRARSANASFISPDTSFQSDPNRSFVGGTKTVRKHVIRVPDRLQSILGELKQQQQQPAIVDVPGVLRTPSVSVISENSVSTEAAALARLRLQQHSERMAMRLRSTHEAEKRRRPFALPSHPMSKKTLSGSNTASLTQLNTTADSFGHILDITMDASEVEPLHLSFSNVETPNTCLVGADVESVCSDDTAILLAGPEAYMRAMRMRRAKDALAGVQRAPKYAPEPTPAPAKEMHSDLGFSEVRSEFSKLTPTVAAPSSEPGVDSTKDDKDREVETQEGVEIDLNREKEEKEKELDQLERNLDIYEAIVMEGRLGLRNALPATGSVAPFSLLASEEPSLPSFSKWIDSSVENSQVSTTPVSNTNIGVNRNTEITTPSKIPLIRHRLSAQMKMNTSDSLNCSSSDPINTVSRATWAPVKPPRHSSIFAANCETTQSRSDSTRGIDDRENPGFNEDLLFDVAPINLSFDHITVDSMADVGSSFSLKTPTKSFTSSSLNSSHIFDGVRSHDNSTVLNTMPATSSSTKKLKWVLPTLSSQPAGSSPSQPRSLNESIDTSTDHSLHNSLNTSLTGITQLDSARLSSIKAALGSIRNALGGSPSSHPSLIQQKNPLLSLEKLAKDEREGTSLIRDADQLAPRCLDFGDAPRSVPSILMR